MSEEEMESSEEEMMGKEEEEAEEVKPEAKMASPGDGPTEDDKLWTLLAYVFSPIVPLILMFWAEKKDRPFIRAHNAQAMVWGLINAVVGTILSTFLCGLPSLALWLVGVYWGWQAYQGQMVTIPYITDFVKEQGWA